MILEFPAAGNSTGNSFGIGADSREILGMLRGRPYSVGEIAANFRTSRPAISKHLRMLRASVWSPRHREAPHESARSMPSRCAR